MKIWCKNGKMGSEMPYYRLAVGKTRRGDSASAAVTNTISPPMNWNMAIVRQVLCALSVGREPNSYDHNRPNSHDSTSGARYGNFITTCKKAGRLVAWAYFESYCPSERTLLGISHQLTAMNWRRTSWDDEQVSLHAQWGLLTPCFDRNH